MQRGGAGEWCRGVLETAGPVFFFAFEILRRSCVKRVARKQKRAPPATPTRFRPGLEPEPTAGAATHPSFVLISSVFVLSVSFWGIMQYY